MDHEESFEMNVPPNLNQQSIEIISKEREIFLRAVLQLLDQRDSFNEEKRSYHHRGTAERGNQSDIIKSGSLLWCYRYILIYDFIW